MVLVLQIDPMREQSSLGPPRMSSIAETVQPDASKGLGSMQTFGFISRCLADVRKSDGHDEAMMPKDSLSGVMLEVMDAIGDAGPKTPPARQSSQHPPALPDVETGLSSRFLFLNKGDRLLMRVEIPLHFDAAQENAQRSEDSETKQE